MLKFYPSHNNFKNRFCELSGQHFGIMESQILTTCKSRNSPNINVCTCKMPNYHKILINEYAEMEHHLSGYGVYNEEAMIRLLGEGIERYALLTAANIYKNKVVYASYNDIEKEGYVVPWEYIKIYSDTDYQKMSGKVNIKNVTRQSTIGWLKCSSLIEKGKEIFIPAQLLFTGMYINDAADEVFFLPGFSKGSAAHTDLKKAIKSAIIEAIEADAFMIRWYTKIKSKRVILDDPVLNDIIAEFSVNLDAEIIAYQYTLDDLPVHTFGLSILNKKDERPIVILGCQAGLDPIKALYRALMEAYAIHYLASNGPLIVPQHYLASKMDYLNLDTNVAFWANANNADFKRNYLKDMIQDEISLSSLKNLSTNDDGDLDYLIKKIKEVSEYGVYLDLTPPEVADKGWKVIRTFFPELVQMSLPSFPYSNHPRINKYGGVRNEYPHPVP